MATLTLKPTHRLRLAPDEELFPQTPAIQGHITCRVCDREETVPLGHPALLCSVCLTDLGATANRISEQYAAAMVAYFEAERALHTRAKGNEWFLKTEQARGNMSVSPEAFQRAWAVAKKEGGEKAILVQMRDWVDETAELMRRAELRYIQADPELEAARLAFGEPVEV